MSKLHDLRAKRQELYTELEASVDTATAEEFTAKSEALKALDSRIAILSDSRPVDTPPAPSFKAVSAEDHTGLPEGVGMSEADVKAYSFIKAIRAKADGRWHTDGGMEKEASDAMAARLGKEPKGFFVPGEVLAGPAKAKFRAALRTTNDGAGGYLVPEDLMADAFIDVLRNKLAVYQAGNGAMVMTGLKGNIAIPKKTTASVMYWVDEGTGLDGTVTKSDMVFGQVTMSPHCGGAATEISRTLMLQSTPDAEALVRGDLIACLTQGIDNVAINGTGAAGQPLGLLGAGISTYEAGGAATVPSWADVVGLETTIAGDNADIGTLAYLTHTLGRGYLKSTPKVSTEAIYMWSEQNTLNGYRAIASNQVPANLSQGGVVDAYALIFGNWADLVIGLWGGMDILVNPYANDLAGAVRVVALQDVDIALRHAKSFAFKACARS
jgi:HK97 family phage major capsid protein